MSKKRRHIRNLLLTIMAPAIIYLFFYTLTNLTGNSGFGVGADLTTIIYNTCYSGFIALAMSFNLTSGRFDFSVGSVLILSLVLGGNLAKQMDAGPFGLLFMVIAVGLVCGLISGLVYTTLRLPPMVTSLGMAMIYEAIAFKLYSSKGLRMLGQFDVLIWSKWPINVMLLLCVVIILTYMLRYTQFGYNTDSLRSGQKNAVDVGVNEKRNAVACYVIAGGLMACAGALYISKFGIMEPVAGLASSSYMMSAFLPLFIGGILAKYSNRNVGVVMGAFMQACLSSALVKLGAASSLITVANGVAVLLLLIYVSNSYKISLFKRYKEKKEKALADTAL